MIRPWLVGEIDAKVRKDIVKILHPSRSFLQTVGLVATKEERLILADLFYRAGAVKVTTVKIMSTVVCGEAHDGEYALRRYTKVTEFEG